MYMIDPGIDGPINPDDPTLPVPNAPGDSEPILITKRGHTDPDDPLPL